MLSKIKTKIKALVGDFAKNDFEMFTYENDSYFFLTESNINSITRVEKNGNELGSGEYSFDSDTNKISISVSLTDGDDITVYYNYNKYSDSELLEYIRAALVWISIFSYCSTDYELEDDEIEPTPDNKTTDLISLIASILVKPDYSEYSLPNITVRFPRTMTKEERIQKLISRFNRSIGINDVIEWNIE